MSLNFVYLYNLLEYKVTLVIYFTLSDLPIFSIRYERAAARLKVLKSSLRQAAGRLWQRQMGRTNADQDEWAGAILHKLKLVGRTSYLTTVETMLRERKFPEAYYRLMVHLYARAPLRSTTLKGLTVAHLKNATPDLGNMRKMVVWDHKTAY